MSVPEQRHLLFEWMLRECHAIKPPTFEIVDQSKIEILLLDGIFQFAVVYILRIEQLIDSGVIAARSVILQFKRRRTKAGATQKVTDPEGFRACAVGLYFTHLTFCSVAW